MSVVTALTAQNTQGVKAVQAVTAAFVAQQIAAVEEDIPPDAIKIGMLVNSDIIEQVAHSLQRSTCRHRVLDPVMVATSGDSLLTDDAVSTLITKLIPHVSIITPNIPELCALCKAVAIEVPSIINADVVEKLTSALHSIIAADQSLWILTKGGHMAAGATADDYLFSQQGGQWFRSTRIATQNTHGTGCTLSSAIAANLSKGLAMPTAVSAAKDYLNSALMRGLDLGRGNGPLWH